MSDTNNNIPTRITQLEEATGYEDGMFFAVAKAGRGTYKIPVDEMTPNEQALSDKLENEIVPAVENSFAYGTVDESEIASFPDGSELPLKVLEVAVNPVQDLHGYDSPWPAGGGKNKFDQDTAYASYKQSDGSFRLTANNAVSIKNYIPQDLLNKQLTFSVYVDLSKETSPNYIRTIAEVGGSLASGTDVSSGNKGYISVTFTPTSTDDYFYFTYGSGGNNYFTMNDLMLEVSSARTAFAPYENDCPIIGWTECKPTVNGKNLFEHNSIAVYTYDFVTNKTFEDMVNPFFMKGGQTYVLTIDSGNKLYRMRAFDKNHEIIKDMSKINATSNGTGLTYYDNANFYGYGSSIANNITVFRPTEDMWFDSTVQTTASTQNMLELGDTPTAYEPYNGSTITIQLGDTYYGSTLDVVSGVLTVERAYVDLGTLDWQYSSISERFYVGASDLGVKATDASTPFNAISSALIAKSYNEIEAKTVDYAIGINPNATQLFARYSSITSASDFITAMDGVQLVYELATPTTIQLTPTQVSSLMGVNNIFANTGKILKVEYIRDLDIVINSLLERIAALEG